MNFLKILGRVGAAIVKPLLREWVFVAACTLMLAPLCVYGLVYTPAQASVALCLAGLMRAFFVACCFGWAAAAWGRVAKWILFSLSALVFIATCGTYLLFRLDVSPKLLMLVAETNVAETGSFFRAFFGWEMVVCMAGFVCMFPLFGLVDKNKGKLRLSSVVNVLIFNVLTVVVLISAVLFAKRVVSIALANNTRDIESLAMPYWSDTPTKIIHALKTLGLLSAENDRWTEGISRDFATPGIAEPDSAAADTLDVVLIIGETYIRSHSGLYGYRLPTTPQQCAERDAGRLVPFDSVSSYYRYTSGAVRSIMSLASVGDSEVPTDGTFFPVLFRKAGWDVAMLDNQHADEFSIFTFTLSSFLYNDAANGCYTFVSDFSDQKDDMNFINHTYRQIGDSCMTAPRRLWIYHLIGQHFNAADRYPHTDENMVFGPADYGWRKEPWLDDTRKQVIADYDNSTRYNDKVVRRILDYHSGRQAVAIYFSDHGEEIYDIRDYRGRKGLEDGVEAAGSGDMAAYKALMHDVPFMIWFSDAYLEANPEMARRAAACAGRPANIDNVGHTLIGLAGIKSPRYRAEHDVLSGSYRSPRPVGAADMAQ